MADYQPIACAQHERLELAVLRRLPLTLRLKDGRTVRGQALDVYTQAGAEWLKFHIVEAGEMTIRLDAIDAVTAPGV